MKKGIKTLSLASVVVLMIFSSCNSNGTVSEANNGLKKDTVIIKMMAFQPNDITVNKGDTIVWINEDIVAHDVSHYPDKSWHSETLQPNDSFEKVIEDSASYFCSIHPTMLAKFEVNR